MTKQLNMSKTPWKQLSSKRIIENQWFSIREDQVRTHTRKVITYTYMEHPGAVAVVPVTPTGEIVLIKSYRYTLRDWCWEVPMGARDHKDLKFVARKELREEIGGLSQDLQHIQYFFANTGVSDIRCDVFLAQDVELRESRTEDSELIEIHVFPKEQVFQFARSGEITDGMSALSLFLCEPYIG